MTQIVHQPREFHAGHDNPVAPAIKGSVITVALLVAIRFWRRGWG